ncbi:MAG: Na+/H+ antiporter subunit E [Lachnospiraceae bacterium]
MFFIYFLLWIIFNGKITLEITIFGIVIAAIMYAFSCKFMDWSPKRDIHYAKNIGYAFYYVGVLLTEILKANIATIRMIFSVKYIREPVLVKFQTRLESNFLKTILANSITLTPGTITVSMKDNEMVVHCLDKDFAEGIEDSIFERILLRLESKGGKTHE